MPKTEGKMKCLICGDIFEFSSEHFSKCKCGNLDVQVSQFSIDYNSKTCRDYEIIERKTYSEADDFIPFTDEMKNLYEQIKLLGTEMSLDTYMYYEQDKEGKDSFIRSFEFVGYWFLNKNNIESNTVQLEVNLRTYSRLSPESMQSSIAEIIDRMKSFLQFLLSVKAGFDPSKRKDMLALAEEKDIPWSKEQVSLYDYTFSF